MLQSNMTVQRLMFFEMGSYHALALRPYQTHTDAQSIGIFNDVTNGGTNLSTNAVAQGCDGLVRPSAQAAGMDPVGQHYHTTVQNLTRLLFSVFMPK